RLGFASAACSARFSSSQTTSDCSPYTTQGPISTICGVTVDCGERPWQRTWTVARGVPEAPVEVGSRTARLRENSEPQVADVRLTGSAKLACSAAIGPKAVAHTS